ncbi:MAG TPA: IS110 family transposase [Enteractinococcus helveticum]|uniref:IS110 family transposase n=1 Tax=Enteractinococcus helveticum TaxID=1837282 RepID=A0A921FMI4_9MICC|nr:IS110 family transposase [Enteractinococcus helveticum]HJF14794.1 IS110 family transposase [Enteractinococcus helveticum]
MTLVAEYYDYVVGIDTHARTHTYAIVNTRTGARDGCQTFPVSAAGIHRAIAWIQRNTSGAILAAVEGTRSYGATITHALTVQNITVVEVKPPRKRQRAGVGKSDDIDATTAAMTVLPHEVSALLQPRSDGLRAALSVLVASRERIDAQRTRNRNALNALLRQIDLGIDARRALTDRQLKEIRNWCVRSTDTIQQRYARAEAVLLATAIMDADQALHDNKQQLAQLNEQLAPTMQHQFGFGAVTVAWILIAYSHPGRVHSEAAFAALAGVAPLQASSGNTIRHRLNRHGDRLLNKALDVIAKTRMRFDEITKQYVEKRTAQGLSYREIKRALKRYLARSIFRQLQVLMH